MIFDFRSAPASRLTIALGFGLAVTGLAFGCSSGSDDVVTAPDTGAPDTAKPDTGSPDTADTRPVETGTADTLADAPADSTVKPFSTKLSETSLYSDWAKKKIAPDALEFSPVYTLWADGAEKRRWIQLPAGGKIDTTDMDNWIFPIGTKFWKEFTYEGKLVETRLIERTDTTTYRQGSYVWAADGSDAIYTEAGATAVNGTDWNVPTNTQCLACHSTSPSKINGFQAIQLSKTTDAINIGTLAEKGLLTAPPAKGTLFLVPGTAAEKAALGYIHANCGHCHNPRWDFFALTNQVLRLTTDTLKTVAETNTVTTTVYKATTSYKLKPWRIVPGDHVESAIWIRPSHRSDTDQMPPIATKKVDTVGLAAIQTWIDGMPKSSPPDAGTGDAGTD